MTASSVNTRNGNGIKPLNGINVAAAKPVISTNKTDSTNGHAYDESDLVSSVIIKPHQNGYARQCSKSNGCSEFESQSNRLNTFYSQMSAKNGFNHSTISIINNKKSINGLAKLSNDNHIENNAAKSNGDSTIENGLLNENKSSSNNRVVSNGNGVSNDDNVNADAVSNGYVNSFPKSKTAGKDRVNFSTV